MSKAIAERFGGKVLGYITDGAGNIIARLANGRMVAIPKEMLAKWVAKTAKAGSKSKASKTVGKDIAEDIAGLAPNSVPRVNFTKQMLANSEVIAKGSSIRKIDELVAAFGGTKKGWVKKKGWDAAGNEWHWYEHHGVGRKGVKLAGEVDPF